VYDWFADEGLAGAEWLVLGKGPSFSLRERFDLRSFRTISLNHVVEKQAVDVAHIIDLDVVDDCQGSLEDNAQWLLMPFHPHVYCRASELSLPDIIPTLPVLQRFSERGRLIWYDLHTGKQHGSHPAARGTFSASVVVRLLGQLGVKSVRTLGVDGGSNYSQQFQYLNEKTLLVNGHSSFDVQFKEISETREKYGMSYEKLVEPIRIFVGCDDSQMVAGKVLEYSIRKHTNHPVEVFFMRNMPVPPPKAKKNRPGTGFSFNRFLIPKLAGYRGKAIYLDADMLVFEDIEKLWNIPMDGKKVLCSSQTEIPKGWEGGKNNDLGPGRYWTPGRQMSVMLMDCDRLDWDIDEIVKGLDDEKYSYKELMAKFCILDEEDIGDTIPNEWNCLEWFEEGRSCLVHFTVVPTQPWKNDRNEHLGEVWTNAYKEAVAAGAVPMELIQELVDGKHIKPSLLELAKEVAPKENKTETPVRDHRQGTDEASELRRMLWDTMISDYTHRRELSRISSSVGWTLENNLIRRPFNFSLRVARAGARRIRHLVKG